MKHPHPKLPWFRIFWAQEPADLPANVAACWRYRDALMSSMTVSCFLCEKDFNATHKPGAYLLLDRERPSSGLRVSGLCDECLDKEPMGVPGRIADRLQEKEKGGAP